jgi:hypothetical protein
MQADAEDVVQQQPDADDPLAAIPPVVPERQWFRFRLSLAPSPRL